MDISTWFSGSSPPLPTRKTRYGEDPDTGWSRGTKILGATWNYVSRVEWDGRCAQKLIIFFFNVSRSDTAGCNVSKLSNVLPDYSECIWECYRWHLFCMATPKKYSVEFGSIDLSSCRLCGIVVDQHYCKSHQFPAPIPPKGNGLAPKILVPRDQPVAGSSP